MKKAPRYKLVPELIPEPLWGISAHRLFGHSKPWKIIRQDTLAIASNKCASCDAASGLQCHDKWEYDDKNNTAMLVGFEIRCALCHLATHLGRAATIGHGEEAIEHLCKINKCTKQEAMKLFAAAMVIWTKRSEKTWTVVIADVLLEKYPKLEGVPLMLLSRAGVE